MNWHIQMTERAKLNALIKFPKNCLFVSIRNKISTLLKIFINYWIHHYHYHFLVSLKKPRILRNLSLWVIQIFELWIIEIMKLRYIQSFNFVLFRFSQYHGKCNSAWNFLQKVFPWQAELLSLSVIFIGFVSLKACNVAFVVWQNNLWTIKANSNLLISPPHFLIIMYALNHQSTPLQSNTFFIKPTKLRTIQVQLLYQNCWISW